MSQNLNTIPSLKGLPFAPSWDFKPRIFLNQVSKSFGQKLIIKKATIDISGGTLLALIGPSGSGKSTVLEIMAKVIAPDQGQVQRLGEASLMFQDNALMPWLNALGNLTFIANPKIKTSQATSNALAWLDIFGLDPFVFPGAMSGGMRRRLSLARTMSASRPIVLLDEPLAFLDEAWHDLISELIANEVNRGSIVVMTGHFTPDPLVRQLGDKFKLLEVVAPVDIEFISGR
ncbi:MAG: ATP-binding cassette domain-containing protein [Deltaproteobacteria bacterium]|nr:ATP-binding cassette domain-containing protein [Deltaproteobacteria bacterium]